MYFLDFMRTIHTLKSYVPLKVGFFHLPKSCLTHTGVNVVRPPAVFSYSYPQTAIELDLQAFNEGQSYSPQPSITSTPEVFNSVSSASDPPTRANLPRKTESSTSHPKSAISKPASKSTKAAATKSQPSALNSRTTQPNSSAKPTPPKPQQKNASTWAAKSSSSKTASPPSLLPKTSQPHHHPLPLHPPTPSQKPNLTARTHPAHHQSRDSADAHSISGTCVRRSRERRRLSTRRSSSRRESMRNMRRFWRRCGSCRLRRSSCLVRWGYVPSVIYRV